METPVTDLATILRTLSPVLHEGVYVFACVPSGQLPGDVAALATFREAEGLTVIAEEGEALRAGLRPMFQSAWITLGVASDLNAVGLTAAVATALGEVGISCNVMAAAFHDHIFVPVEKGAAALERLQDLQKG